MRKSGSEMGYEEELKNIQEECLAGVRQCMGPSYPSFDDTPDLEAKKVIAVYNRKLRELKAKYNKE